MPIFIAGTRVTLGTAKKALNRLVPEPESADPRFTKQIIYLQIK